MGGMGFPLKNPILLYHGSQMCVESFLLMDEISETPSNRPQEPRRCPQCDSVVTAVDSRCLMCGAELVEPSPPLAPPAPAAASDVVEPAPPERESRTVFWLTAVFTVIIIALGTLVLRFRGSDMIVALVPTVTPIPPTITYTPTWTPLPVHAGQPTATPLATAVPSATPTPPPPRPHTVVSGETLIGLALRYRVSVASIAEANSFPPDTALLVDQPLLVPWPTPTPPLVPVATLINGETVIADPTDCQRYEVKSGDSLSGIAARYDVDFGLMLQVNRLTEDSIPQPGDVVCIPEIIYGGSLPPTPGPSPTPTVTSLPPGPQLLYPVDNAIVEPPDSQVTLQWTAVKTLAENEWYMVELADLDRVDSLPYRGFTRDTAFQVPSSWRPPLAEMHTLRWQVSIVRVTGRRADGRPIYTYGGEGSAPAFFSWQGAVPTPTPLPTSTATPQA